MWDPKLRNNSFDFTAQINPDPAVIARTLDEAVPIQASQLAAQPPGTVVALRAVVHPGPQGLLRAPLSGAQCVWYRSAVVPGFGRTAVPAIGSSDSTPVLEGGTVSARRRLRPSEEISTAPFLVGDADVGAASIDPLQADVDTDVRAIDEVRRPERIATRALVREWILEPGAVVFVTGRVAADGSLRSDGAALLLSTSAEEQVRDRALSNWSQFSHHAGQSRIRNERLQAGGRKYLHYFFAALIVIFVIFVVVVTLTT